MKLTFLGTGTSQGVPVIGCDCKVCRSLDFRDKRLRTSAHIEVDGLSLVIDTGPDFRQQMLREHIARLDAVLFTHEHKDHTAGMDDIRPYNFSQGINMPLYARPQVLEQLKREYAYVFASTKYPGVPTVETHTIGSSPFKINDLTVTPIQVMHHKLPVLGFRIHGLSYITDANHIPDEEKEKIFGSKVLVINALQKTEHLSHFTLAQALELIAEVQPERAYIVHIGHRLGLHADIDAELPSNVFLAHDGLKVTF